METPINYRLPSNRARTEYPSAILAQASKKITWNAVHMARVGPKPVVDTPEISVIFRLWPKEACKIATIAYLDNIF